MTARYRYLTDTGAIAADTATVKADVEAEYKLALGPSLDTSPATPQGTLIAGEVIARTEVMKNNAELANMTNPDLAYGTFLDAICSLLGVQRGTNRSTVGLSVKVTGNNLTVIPALSRLTTSDNDVFETINTVTIPLSGITTVDVRSQAYGPVVLPLGALRIVDGTIGWGDATVTTDTTVTVGALALKDPALKNKRSQQLAKQGVGSTAAIRAAALDVPNVTSVQVVENNTGAPGLVNGVTFTLGNAFWVCVAGTPNLSALAQALYEAHNGGLPWDFGAAGDGTPLGTADGLPAVDAATGHTYMVKVTKPILYDCYVRIVVKQATSSTSPGPAIQTAMTAYARGEEEGELGLVVGASVSAFELAGAVARQLPALYVKSCAVAVVPAGSPAPVYPADYSTEAVMNQFDQAILQNGNINVILVE